MKETFNKLNKKKEEHITQFNEWINKEPSDVQYSTKVSKGEFRMTKKKEGPITLALIYKELMSLKTKTEDFITLQEEFNTKQEEFNTKQEEFNEKVIARLDNIEKDVQVLKTDVAAMKNTPTMKKELNL